MAAQARSARAAAPVASVQDAPAAAGTVIPLTPVQAWFAALDPADAAHWNQAFVFEVPAALDRAALAAAVQAVAAHHDVFRLRFERVEGSWRPVYGEAPSIGFAEVEVGVGDAAAAITAEADRANRALDLAAGPLARVVQIGRAHV